LWLRGPPLLISANGVQRLRAPQHKAGWLYLIDAMDVPGEWVQRRPKALYLVGGFSA
jgi:hypothetical protein